MPKTSPAIQATATARRPSYENLLSARDCRTVYRALDLVRKALDKAPELLSSPQAVRDYLQIALAAEEREVFMCLWLDAQNRLIEAEQMFVGTLTQTSVYPREVVKAALRHNAASVIFSHNHPSGISTQSLADEELTTVLRAALNLVDVRVLDHIIVAGATPPFSFAERCIRPFGSWPLASWPVDTSTPVTDKPRRAKRAPAKKKGGAA